MWVHDKTLDDGCTIFVGPIIERYNDHLPIGLIAQLVEHCTGIAESRSGQNFLGLSRRYYLSRARTLKNGVTQQFKYVNFMY